MKGRSLRSLVMRIKKIAFLVASIPCFSLFIICKPFLKVRFLTIEVSRIGGLERFDWFMSSRKVLPKAPGEKFVCIYVVDTGQVGNKFLLKLCKRTGAFSKPNWFWRGVYEWCQTLLKDKTPMVTLPEFEGSKMGELARSALRQVQRQSLPWIHFSENEKEVGRRKLIELGVSDGGKFICFHARDPLFLNKIDPRRDWGYHDYRDSSIKNYVRSAEWLANQGVAAIRVGSIVKDPIDVSTAGVIDYSLSGFRSDFMDIYLSSECWFFICSDCGISVPPEMFRKPMVYVNHVPISRLFLHVPFALFIPKYFRSIREGRILSYREVLTLGLGMLTSQEELNELQIEVIENSPEEILAITREMTSRLDGSWEESEEEKELQERFWSLYSEPLIRSENFRIGFDFLNENEELFFGKTLCASRSLSPVV